MHKHKHPRHGIDKHSLKKITDDFNVLFETTKSEGAIAFKLIDIDKKLNGERSIKIFVPAGNHKEYVPKLKQTSSKGKTSSRTRITIHTESRRRECSLKNRTQKILPASPISRGHSKRKLGGRKCLDKV
jgi:hypothetical protein